MTHLRVRVCAVCASMRPRPRLTVTPPLRVSRRHRAAGRCCWQSGRREPRPPAHPPQALPAHRRRLPRAPSAAPCARCPRRAALASSPGGASGRIGRTRRERAPRAACPRARAAGGARMSSTRPRSCALPRRACRVRGTKRDRAERRRARAPWRELRTQPAPKSPNCSRTALRTVACRADPLSAVSAAPSTATSISSSRSGAKAGIGPFFHVAWRGFRFPNLAIPAHQASTAVRSARFRRAPVPAPP